MKTAMTYLEVILALIIISITVSISYPKYDDDRIEVAADELIAQMKYISYLATLEDNFDVEDKFFRYKLWQIRFHTRLDGDDVIAYSIFKDKRANDYNRVNLNKTDFLFDKFAGKEISPYAVKYDKDRNKINKSTFLHKMYGIDKIIFPKNCKIGQSKKLMFDRYGNVYHQYNTLKYDKKDRVSRSSLFKPKCPTYKLVLVQGDEKVGICVETSTSYIYKCKA